MANCSLNLNKYDNNRKDPTISKTSRIRVKNSTQPNQKDEAEAKLLARILLSEKKFTNGEYAEYSEISSCAKAKYGL